MSKRPAPYGGECPDPDVANRGRPAGFVVPGPGQESVWDYPRPPRLESVFQTVKVEFGGVVLAETPRAFRVCETASPPVYYIPRADVAMRHLEPTRRTSFCEWKGTASYWSVRVGTAVATDAAWSYARPAEAFGAIRDYLAFYPGRVSACWVGEDRVTPQPGGFYGGWITPNLVGPFKGAPGSEWW